MAAPARTNAVLARLAPSSAQVRLADLHDRVFLGGLSDEARRGRPEDVHGPLLRGALLTDAELAAGEDAWRALPDPFGWWHTEPCEPSADLGTAATGLENEER